MNEKEKRSFYNQYKSLYQRLTKLMQPRVEKALREQVKVFTDAYKEHPHVTPVIIPPAIIEKSLIQVHITGGLNGAKLTEKNIKKQVKKSEDEAEARWTWVINEYIKQNGLTNLAVEITNTLREQIKKVLLQANTNGWGIDKTVRMLNTASFPKWMATRIVRTELNKAANTGAMVAATDAGIELDKEWLTAGDSRVRFIPRNQYDHVFMNGRRVGMDEKFIVPSTKSIDAMLYPGDPSASVGNVANCRCAVLFIPKRDGEGKPVESPAHQPNNPFKKLLDQAAAFGKTILTQVTNIFKEHTQQIEIK